MTLDKSYLLQVVPFLFHSQIDKILKALLSGHLCSPKTQYTPKTVAGSFSPFLSFPSSVTSKKKETACISYFLFSLLLPFPCLPQPYFLSFL